MTITLRNSPKFKPRDYMDIPFLAHGRDRVGLDCWGLVCLIYLERLSIHLPHFAGVAKNISNPEDVSPLFEGGAQELWRRVDVPQYGDVVGWRAGKLIYHVGLYLEDNKFLHIQKATESHVSEIGSMLWPSHRMAGYFRYINL